MADTSSRVTRAGPFGPVRFVSVLRRLPFGTPRGSSTIVAMHDRTRYLPDPLLPLLITGISGVAGYNALPYFRRQFGNAVVGIRQTR